MGPEYWVTTLDITPFAVAQKHVYENAEELYDISPGGEIYAFLGMKDHLLVTNLVEANTSKTLQTVPYRVKLLNDEHRLLVRDFSSAESEWKLLENEKITCTFSGLTNSRFSWKLSKSGENFAVLTSSNNVIIWNVSSCSIKNVLHFGK
jgi:WD40 repeat protein